MYGCCVEGAGSLIMITDDVKVNVTGMKNVYGRCVEGAGSVIMITDV